MKRKLRQCEKQIKFRLQALDGDSMRENFAAGSSEIVADEG
jgi:hypothetical protein